MKTQLHEQLAAVAVDPPEEDDDSEDSIDDLIADVLQRIDEYQGKPDRKLKVDHSKDSKPSKLNVLPGIANMAYTTKPKGQEVKIAENKKKIEDTFASESKEDTSNDKFEFGQSDLMDDPVLRQDWRQKNIIRDLVDDIDNKITQK